MLGRCALCRQYGSLQRSHILPSFVSTWLKRTSATGFFRTSLNVKRRAQDGPKCYLLCRACEQRLSRWENKFAREIFHPLNESPNQKICYGADVLKFSTSVSWRAATFMWQDDRLSHFTDGERDLAQRAMQVWADFMLETAEDVGKFQQHILVCDAIGSMKDQEFPPNLNRFIQRSFAFDAVRSSDTCFILTKMGKFINLGFIKLNPNEWEGTRILANGGTIGSQDYTVPAPLGTYLAEKARRVSALNQSVPAPQRQKLNEFVARNPERVANSGTFKAMLWDLRRFGRAALTDPQNEKSD